MGVLRRIQEGLRVVWTEEGYSEAFKESGIHYKHFDHTLKHIRKASQALENITEEADHGNSKVDDTTLRKYIADIVISAIRLGNVWPSEGLDVEDAVRDRLEKKMGMKVERDDHDKELEMFLVQRLDGCWCDDGKLLPECPRCISIRALLNVLQKRT